MVIDVIAEGASMNMIISSEKIQEISQGLSIIRCFTDRRTYKSLRESCLVQISGDNAVKDFGKIKLKKKPTLADFFMSIATVGTFVLNKENWYVNKPSIELNSKGLHSESVIACMDILLRNKDFQCMEELCELIDDDDSNERAKSVKRMLLTTRNNMIAPKGKDDVS